MKASRVCGKGISCYMTSLLLPVWPGVVIVRFRNVWSRTGSPKGICVEIGSGCKARSCTDRVVEHYYFAISASPAQKPNQ